jgi:hypothetical protein
VEQKTSFTDLTASPIPTLPAIKLPLAVASWFRPRSKITRVATGCTKGPIYPEECKMIIQTQAILVSTYSGEPLCSVRLPATSINFCRRPTLQAWHSIPSVGAPHPYVNDPRRCFRKNGHFPAPDQTKIKYVMLKHTKSRLRNMDIQATETGRTPMKHTAVA